MIDLLDLVDENKKTTKNKKKEVDPITGMILASQRGAWIYFLAREAAREAAYEALRGFLEIMSKEKHDDDIDKEIKKLQLEELKDRIRLKRQLREELIPIIKQQVAQLTLQQQLQNALNECVKRKKAKLIKELKREGFQPWEIQMKLLELEADVYEECEDEIKGVLSAYQGDVEVSELPTPEDYEEGESDEEE